MAERDDDIRFGQVAGVVLLQILQVSIGTAIGAGVLLLIGVLGVLLSPILVPVFLIRYLRQRKAQAGGRRAAAGGGGEPPPGV